jgi:PAS domain S-box-containing protein
MPEVVPCRVVAIVEDDPLVCAGLRDTLESGGWQVADYASAEQFLACFQPGQVGCLLLDARLPGMSGPDLLIRLRADGQQIPVIMITGASDIRIAVAVMKAGASDFIEKPVSPAELLRAVDRSWRAQQDPVGSAARHSDAAARIDVLTGRQREVMTLVLEGHPNKVIAARLGISQRTVENHRAKVMARTGSESLPDLARLAQSASWARPDAKGVALPDPTEPALSTNLPAGQFDDEQFRRFFDAMPMAIVIAAMTAAQTIVYANPAFARLTGQVLADVQGQSWAALRGVDTAQPARTFGLAMAEATDRVGTFALDTGTGDRALVDAYASVIVDDDGNPAFRLMALVELDPERVGDRDAFEDTIREKEAMILEIQHRVKNNLQMITSLIRLEARNNFNNAARGNLERLEGRINSIQIIYRLLSDFSQGDQIDLGVYLSEIASSVMHAHAVEGIRLDLCVDAYPVSVNVALPSGLVANELLTNALKHAFAGRDGGTITLHSLSDQTGCRVTIADDGIGLPAGVVWPKPGKLGELIVRSLRHNAKADLQVTSAPGKGTCVTIAFNREAAALASAV